MSFREWFKEQTYREQTGTNCIAGFARMVIPSIRRQEDKKKKKKS
jgi:hypothetical protein